VNNARTIMIKLRCGVRMRRGWSRERSADFNFDRTQFLVSDIVLGRNRIIIFTIS